VFGGQTASGDPVAVKKLHLSAAAAAHRELRIAEELKGRSFEHVVSFIDAGEDADTGDYFVVMPKAEGNLQARIDQDAPLNAAETASVLLQITEGLIEVGELVHRDLKPDNVLLHEGKWKVADLGIARFFEEATSSNTLKECLSPLYAAPEQWHFERATHATDVYALGCIGFCSLVGNPPFRTNPAEEHQRSPVPAFACGDSRLAAIVNMMLRKLPQTRPVLSRVRDLLADIVAKPQEARSGKAQDVLANAAADVADKEQKVQAQEQAEMTAHLARVDLAKAAFEILAENVERLWGKIHAYAPNATRGPSSRGSAFGCQLGNGSLAITLDNSNYVEPGKFSRSGWDVIAGSTIKVNQHQRPYRWSASVWYMKLKDAAEYRWYEVSYRVSHQAWSGDQFEPFACSDLTDADYAASNMMHSVAVAFGPAPIDDDKEDEFHERWIWILAKAATGQLKTPPLPIRSWPPNL
jgi:serine/threonine-protein kinase